MSKNHIIFLSLILFLSLSGADNTYAESFRDIVDLKTYTSRCPASNTHRNEHGIVYPKDGKVDAIYIFFHGYGNPDPARMCNSDKMCENAAKLKQNGLSTAILLPEGNKMSDGAGGDHNFTREEMQCYLNEAKQQLRTVARGGIPDNIAVAAGHSAGGSAVMNYVNNGFNAGKYVILDGCYRRFCDPVVSRYGSQTYIYTSPGGGTLQYATAFKDRVAKYLDTSLSHNDVRNKCFLDHAINDNCTGSGTGVNQPEFDAGVMEKIKQIKPPKLAIRIPGLRFTETIATSTEDEQLYIHLPWIGEYVVALYQWSVVVASIVALVMLVFQGFRIVVSGGGEQKIAAYKRIGQIVIGLIIAWESYVILYFVNPGLVEYNALKVAYVKGEALFGPGADEENRPTEGNWTTGITNYTITNQCLPIKSGSLDHVSWNWGDDRDNGVRCHAGIDLYTKDRAEVVALDTGTIVNIQKFKTCDGGITKAILINHPSLGNKTILYGELDQDKIPSGLKAGVTVQKGQALGVASYCQMLHLETYEGRVSRNKRWPPPEGQSTIGNNKCAREFLRTKPAELLDPTNLIKQLENRPCT